jgi:adenosylcobinamide kinase/adenosylcobinamide-phosphate guanylyltransferase
MLTVLLGGARAGKSAFAERLAAAIGAGVTYIATCPRIDGDDELESRIGRHRADRPSSWTTIEEEHDLAEALDRCGDETVIIDCLTTWVSNLQFAGLSEQDVLHSSTHAVEAATSRRGTTIVVTNEVGLGIVPVEPIVRAYRDVLGRVNQQWVAAADRALLVVAGRALVLDRPEDL